MNCSSLPDNQTADFIERFFPFTYNQILENDSGCYDFVNHEYVIWHRSLAEALPLSVQQYGYDSIPNLYTILDTSSLDSAGISRTAEQPFLGNKGRGHHIRSVFPASTSYEDVELRVGPGERGFTLELWARESELYSVGFLSPSGDETGRIRLSGDEERRIPFLLEGTTIHLNYTSSELATGSELILMRFDAPAAGIWKIRVYHTLSIQGEYHMWLPVHGFISDETFFLRPDPDTTITDPGNTAAIITTAAYSHQTGGIYLHSSRGFTRTGAIKPDLAAPGVRLPLPDYQEVTGTSFAAAMTAGAAAILLSWSAYTPSAPRINTSIAKAFLIRGADRRNSIEYPSREWGYGTLNLYNSFLSMRS